MSNYELYYYIDSYESYYYKLYLRSESINKLTDFTYKQDKSLEGYLKSDFYKLSRKSIIDYSEYICESVDKTINYTEYIAKECMNISYSEYISEKIK